MNRRQILDTIRAIVSNPTRETFILQLPSKPTPKDTALKDFPQEELAKLAELLAGNPAQVLSPTFKILFLTVLLLIVASAAGAAAIAFIGPEPLSQNQQTIFETLNTTWKTGIAAVVGLLAGKAT